MTEKQRVPLMERLTRVVEYVSFWSLPLAVLSACFWFVYGEMKAIDADLKATDARLTQQMMAQAARSDRLYEIVIDLLKQNRG